MNFRKNTYVYLASNIINAAIPFVLIPILTRYLLPSEYGQIAMFQALVTGVSSIVGLNSVGAANRRFYDENVTDDELKSFNGSCFQILIITMLLSFLTIFLCGEYISLYLSIPESWLYISCIMASGSFIVNFRLGQWQIRKLAIRYGILQVGSSVVNMMLSLALIILYGQGAQGRIEAMLYTGLIFASLSAFLLYFDNLVNMKRVNYNQIKEALSFGVPLVPHVFGTFLLMSADRIIINNKLGLSDAGTYMVAFQVSIALTIVFDAVNKAYTPWLFEKLKSSELKEKHRIVKYTYYYFAILFLVAVLSFITGPIFIELVVGPEYKSASGIIGWLCLGQIFGGMYLMVTNYLFYMKKTFTLALVTLGIGLINILSMVILVELLGLKGAAIAFASSKLLQFIVTWFYAQRVINMPWFRKVL